MGLLIPVVTLSETIKISSGTFTWERFTDAKCTAGKSTIRNAPTACTLHKKSGKYETAEAVDLPHLEWRQSPILVDTCNTMAFRFQKIAIGVCNGQDMYTCNSAGRTAWVRHANAACNNKAAFTQMNTTVGKCTKMMPSHTIVTGCYAADGSRIFPPTTTTTTILTTTTTTAATTLSGSTASHAAMVKVTMPMLGISAAHYVITNLS
eukprot:TRINITY_DN17909_c0_g1_i1.p1 TRINITY_DN17909_c0_g1~~TRINITY_DN17909_c0_g1_i1.p1  ORF type:complete len:207 (-),score=28.74 TRINITY_DN17909_c0_g1_i1:116-736(-)